MKKTSPRSKTENLGQPFYGDLLARSLLRIGVQKFEAYEVSHSIWKKVAHKKDGLNEVAGLVTEFLKEKYPHLLKRYQAWRKILKSPKPLILLICGGTGIGTSTLAVRLAWLLEINHVEGTDSVREIVRHLLPQSVIPTLAVSTFEEGSVVSEIKSKHDRLIYGFTSQSQKVLYGVEALVARAIREKKSTVIEGIHLIPGHMDFLQKYARQATFIPIMVDIRSKASHHERFMSRGAQNSKRPQTRYLKFFKEIRLIRDYLIRQAERKSVPVVENYDLRHAEREILDHIFNHYQKNKKS